jgi:hypothetical protein
MLIDSYLIDQSEAQRDILTAENIIAVRRAELSELKRFIDELHAEIIDQISLLEGYSLLAEAFKMAPVEKKEWERTLPPNSVRTMRRCLDKCLSRLNACVDKTIT